MTNKDTDLDYYESINRKARKVNKDLLKEILDRFEIVEALDSVDYDDNFDLLDHKIKALQDISFLPNQRILFFYHDTAFYKDLNCGSSVFLFNLYQILKKYNIPPEFIILFTSHYGIKKEINRLNSIMDYSIEKIIETPLWFFFPIIEKIQEIKEQSCTDDKKEFLFTCLNNVERVHRNYTLCCLNENNLLDLGIVSYRFKNDPN